MNEIPYLRNQLAQELRRLEDVAAVCAATIAEGAPASEQAQLLRACADYLLQAIKQLEARDRARLALHYARSPRADFPPPGEALRELERIIEQAHAGWSAVESALVADRAADTGADAAERNGGSGVTGDGSAPSSNGLASTLEHALALLRRWLEQRDCVRDALSDRDYSVADWRATSFVSASSILEERTRYARVEATLPSGMRLATSSTQDARASARR